MKMRMRIFDIFFANKLCIAVKIKQKIVFNKAACLKFCCNFDATLLKIVPFWHSIEKRAKNTYSHFHPTDGKMEFAKLQRICEREILLEKFS